MLAKAGPVVCFEAMDDPSIQRLDIRCEVWFKELNLYVCWFIFDVVSTEVINGE
jgi:hypothetical protein